MKRFITVRIWEETKDKLEQVRINRSIKEKKVISLAQVIEDLVEDCINENTKNNPNRHN